jgi:signal transduction histidine kinase
VSDTANKAPPDAERVLTAGEAALRWVAALARESSPLEILVAVTREAARVLGCDAVGLLRFEPDETATLVAQSDTPWDPPPSGTRLMLDGENVVVQVLRTGRAARVDDLTDSTGAVGAMAKTLGVRSAVASPVVVGGRLWGTIIAATSRSEPLPAETEPRIAQFTELIATPIANAEARRELVRLAEEQAALRRVATLVARQPSQEETFAAVVEAIGPLLDADYSGLILFTDDVAGTVVSSWSREGPGLPVGTRLPLDDNALTARVFRSAASVRIDGHPRGIASDTVRTLKLRSAVGAPVLVDGKLWGMLAAVKGRDQLLAEDAEARIAAFTELVATAIANAQAHSHLQQLADEQAALRRVATLVAAEASQEEIFTALAEGVAGALGEELRLVRFEGDVAVVVATSDGPHIGVLPVGTRLPVGGNNALSHVFRTGEPIRIDDYSTATGRIAEEVRPQGLRSIVATPIVVEGRTWGAMIVGTFGEEPVPPGTEGRLGQFAELMATGIANTEARSEIERLARQEAALRRIATLIAQGVKPEQVFAAVADETAATFNAVTAVLRFEHEPPAVVIAGVSAETGVPIGTRWELAEGMVAAQVYRTGRSARMVTGTHALPSGSWAAETSRRLGLVSQVGCPIIVEGSVWGAMTVNGREVLPADTEQRLQKFTELVTTAIANATTRAELVASRARIVAAGDEARRRIERNLHDGTQQQLIALGLDLQRTRTAIPDDQAETRSALVGIEQRLAAILVDLRELSHGLHPPLLSRLGLGPALRALARRSPIPVQLEVDLPERPAASLETATYYVVSEALTNAIKHSQASAISVTITGGENLHASIADDGVGDADRSGGSGLTGLLDRVDALGGRFALDSPPQGGTRVSIELPMEPTVAS